MRLTAFSDYAFRVMLYAAMTQGKQFVIDDVNKTLNISRANLAKVINTLTKTGFLTSMRGRNGGLRLARPAHEITLGTLLSATENDFDLVECMRTDCDCVFKVKCKIPLVLRRATQSFLSVMDEYTLADVAVNPEDFLSNVNQNEAKDE